MKRIICLLLAVMLFLFSIAYAEDGKDITFLGIPWLSDDVSVSQILVDKGYLYSGSHGTIMENCYYLMENNEGNIEQVENGQYKDYCRSFSFRGDAMGKIAGYPLKSITLSYAYNGTYQLLYAEIELLGGTYEDIKSKLETVYGTGEQFETALGYQITAWKGANNSCVVLYTYDDGMTYNLYYGRTDANEIMANCLVIDPNDVSGL